MMSAQRRLARPSGAPVIPPGGWRVALFIVLIFVIGSDILQMVMGPGGPASKLRFVLLVPMFGLVLVHLRQFLHALRAAPELTALIFLAILTMAWTVWPEETGKRLALMTATTFMAMTLASLLSLRGLILALGALAVLSATVSLLAIIAIPEARGIDPWPNTWRGAFNHKNGFGAVCAIGLISVTASSVLTRGWARLTFGAGAVLVLMLLIASDSRTAQLICGISILSFLIAVRQSDYSRVWAAGYLTVLGLLIGLIFVIFATGLAAAIIEALGRKPTLSGRIPLWELTWPEMTERLWFGYGYNAFWNPEARRVLEIARDAAIGYIPNYSHNGLIELILNVGLVSLPLLILATARAIAGVFVAMRLRDARVAAAAALVMIVAFFLFNITESNILGNTSLNWMTVVALLTKLGQVLRISRVQVSSAPRAVRLRRLRLLRSGAGKVAV